MLLTTIRPLLLASASPRRRQMLEHLGLTFTADTADIDESLTRGENPRDFVLRLAGDKAVTVAGRHPDSWVLAADTVVVIGNTIMGKPADDADAARMLGQLSGRTHQVWTGYCLFCCQGERLRRRAVMTEVEFRPLSEALIRAYVASGEPLDKAGGYGIQGLAAAMVGAIRGSYTNVVGLPLAEVIEDLLDLGVVTPRSPQGKW
ncbi:MAG: nucleoside triphosphate pyrophosphatase [Thermodesulfobacteriota bacterium]|jgi:septum formation protein